MWRCRFMRSLVERIHLTVHLAVLDQKRKRFYIEKVEAPGFFKVNTWVGRRMFLPFHERREMLAGLAAEA